MSTDKTNAPHNQRRIDAFPPEILQALQQLDEYARKPRQIRSPEELAEFEQKITDLTEQLARSAFAHAVKKDRALSPELKNAAEEMIRNFSLRKRDARG